MMSLPNRIHAVVQLNIGFAAATNDYIPQPCLPQPDRILERALRALDVDFERIEADFSFELDGQLHQASTVYRDEQRLVSSHQFADGPFVSTVTASEAKSVRV
jgi:hypothetical protein